MSTCTVKEGLTAQNVTATLCHRQPRDNSRELKATHIALTLISTAFILMRICHKLFSAANSRIGPDDYFIIIALLVIQSNAVIVDRGLISNGLGKDIWTVSFDHITAFAKYFYWAEMLYFAQLALLKVSFLFFYKRIFTGCTIQKIIGVTILFNILFGIAFVVASIFQCRPISYYWTAWDGEHTGSCGNMNGLAWANAAISIAVDLWMLALPMSQVIHLKLSRAKKAGVMTMFCLGTFATVISVIRLQTLILFARSKNPTWDQQTITKWSGVEVATGIVCSCIPATRIILVRVLPRAFSSASDSKYRNRLTGKISKSTGVHAKGSNKGERVIHCAMTFELNRTQKDDDEAELVEDRI